MKRLLIAIPRALLELATRICIVKKIRLAIGRETRDSSAKTAPRARISRKASQTRDIRVARVVFFSILLFF